MMRLLRRLTDDFGKTVVLVIHDINFASCYSDDIIAMADGKHQILHVDKMCNECGNCTQFCPYDSAPSLDKFTLFQTAEDMVDSKNAGVLFLGGDKVRVRLFGEPKDYDLSDSKNGLPADLEVFILRIRDQYSYLYK